MAKLFLVCFFSIALLFTCYKSFSQAPEIEWERCLGGKQNDVLIDADEDSQGNIGISAITNSCDNIVSGYHGEEDILVLKLNNNGDIQWTQVWGGSKKDVAVQCLFNKERNSLYVLGESNSADGDLSFKKTNTKNVFFLGYKEDGTPSFDVKMNHLKGDLDVLQSAGKFVLSKGNLPMLSQIYCPLNFTGSQPQMISRVLNEKAAYPGHIERTLYINSEVEGCMKTNDFYYNPDDMGLAMATTVIDKVIFVSSAYKDREKMLLKGFHQSDNYLSRRTSDACIFSISGGYYYGQYLKNTKCIGGKGNDSALKVFETSYQHYRLLISSDSKDGDFKFNNGGKDIWLVDLDKNLVIKNRRNIGTPLNDNFLGIANGQNIFGVLMNSAEQYCSDNNKSIYNEIINQPLPVKTSSEKKYAPVELVADDNAPGLKLDISNSLKPIVRLNFNFSDKDASIWYIGGNNFVVAANRKTGDDNDVCLIGIDAIAGRISWQKELGGTGFERITKVLPAKDGGFFAVGTTTSNGTGKMPAGNGGSDIWIVKFSYDESKKKNKIAFYDNTTGQSSGSFTDSSLYIADKRLQAVLFYRKDSLDMDALWTIAQTSEYLADFSLAANSYTLILSRIDKVRNKFLFSQAKAHQITCKFLAQSQEDPKPLEESPDENQKGFYGIGVDRVTISNHLMIRLVTAGKGAYLAGIKPCDEIIAIDGMKISDDCFTSETIFKKITGEKGTSVQLTINRFRVKTPLQFTVKRSFIPINQSRVKSASDTIISASQLNKAQQQKQNFLKKIITAIQKDTIVMKNFETAKKINYALAILNKWGNNPIPGQYFTQIDEQLGMVSSLLGIIKSKDLNSIIGKDGKITFGSPEMKELMNTDYAKRAGAKFDSIAHLQEIKETKIDNKITFVEKNKPAANSGYYRYIENYSTYGHSDPSLFGEPDTWVRSEVGESPCIRENKTSPIRIEIKEDRFLYEYTWEYKTLPCTTGTSGLMIYMGTHYSKRTSKGVGQIAKDNKNIHMEFNTEAYLKMEPGKSVMNLSGREDVEYTQGIEKTEAENNSIDWEIEYLPDSKIKLTSKHGYNILQKIRDL